MAATTLDDLLAAGWGEHDAKTAEVADRLEANVALVADADGAAKFMQLANHCIGDHAGDRARALRVCRAAVERVGATDATGHLVQLAVACHMAGEAADAAEAQRLAGETAEIGARVQLLVAGAQVHAGRLDLAAQCYAAGLDAVAALPAGNDAERSAAIVSNNLASELLERHDRDATANALMAQAAEAARTYWLRVGDWTHDERSDYLLALVQVALGDAAAGRTHAERGLATIAANGAEPVDEAFLHLARARTCAGGADPSAYAESLARADALAADFDPGLRGWYDTERAKVPAG